MFYYDPRIVWTHWLLYGFIIFLSVLSTTAVGKCADKLNYVLNIIFLQFYLEQYYTTYRPNFIIGKCIIDFTERIAALSRQHSSTQRTSRATTMSFVLLYVYVLALFNIIRRLYDEANNKPICVIAFYCCVECFVNIAYI